ncbi:hypothetical protein NHQ30_009941 [Ciborinia camelliae]|nr:hypothetical protein NHQ30_009941 [Ciborinia camelliae]
MKKVKNDDFWVSIYECFFISAHVIAVHEDFGKSREDYEAKEYGFEDFDEMKTAIQESIDWLHRLSSSVRAASSSGENKGAKDFPLLADPEDADSEDLTPRLIDFYSEIVKREFPALTEVFRKRLAQSIVLRRKRILYRKSTHEIWAMQQDTNLRNSSQKLQPPQTTPKESFSSDNERKMGKPAVQVNAAGTKFTGPVLQPERLEGIKDQQQIQKDIEPYKWLEHMQAEHAMRWHCVARDHSPSVFLSQDDFKTHMQTEHSDKFKDELLDYIAASSACPLENVFNNHCPFCGQPAVNMAIHVGDHLRYLAVLTLPSFEDKANDTKPEQFCGSWSQGLAPR